MCVAAGQPDKVDELGRRLSSKQVTELMAYYQLRDGAPEPRPTRRSAQSPDRHEFTEADLRAGFRAHNRRLGAA
jgi:hypothetical protein